MEVVFETCRYCQDIRRRTLTAMVLAIMTGFFIVDVNVIRSLTNVAGRESLGKSLTSTFRRPFENTTPYGTMPVRLWAGSECVKGWPVGTNDIAR